MSRVQALDWDALKIWEQGPAFSPSAGPLLVSKKKCFFPSTFIITIWSSESVAACLPFLKFISVGHSLGFTTGAWSWLSASQHEPFMTVHMTVGSGPQGTDYNIDFEQQSAPTRTQTHPQVPALPRIVMSSWVNYLTSLGSRQYFQVPPRT